MQTFTRNTTPDSVIESAVNRHDYYWRLNDADKAAVRQATKRNDALFHCADWDYIPAHRVLQLTKLLKRGNKRAQSVRQAMLQTLGIEEV